MFYPSILFFDMVTQPENYLPGNFHRKPAELYIAAGWAGRFACPVCKRFQL
jgi:hypothetical protein